MANPFNKPDANIRTGVQGSVATDLEKLAAQADGVEAPKATTAVVSGGGYLSYQVSAIQVGETKIAGISTERGFYYPVDLGEPAMKELAALAKRGFAYELNKNS